MVDDVQGHKGACVRIAIIKVLLAPRLHLLPISTMECLLWPVNMKDTRIII